MDAPTEGGGQLAGHLQMAAGINTRVAGVGGEAAQPDTEQPKPQDIAADATTTKANHVAKQTTTALPTALDAAAHAAVSIVAGAAPTISLPLLPSASNITTSHAGQGLPPKTASVATTVPKGFATTRPQCHSATAPQHTLATNPGVTTNITTSHAGQGLPPKTASVATTVPKGFATTRPQCHSATAPQNTLATNPGATTPAPNKKAPGQEIGPARKISGATPAKATVSPTSTQPAATLLKEPGTAPQTTVQATATPRVIAGGNATPEGIVAPPTAWSVQAASTPAVRPPKRKATTRFAHLPALYPLPPSHHTVSFAAFFCSGWFAGTYAPPCAAPVKYNPIVCRIPCVASPLTQREKFTCGLFRITFHADGTPRGKKETAGRGQNRAVSKPTSVVCYCFASRDHMHAPLLCTTMAVCLLM